MIKGVYNNGRYVQVSNGSPSWPSIYNTYGSHNSNGPSNFTGQLRYNTTNQCMEVFDGNNWQMMGTSIASVGLTPEAERILDWARDKMNEEAMLKIRMEKHPGLKDAWEKFKIMDVLTLEEEKIGKEEAGVQAGP